MLVSGRAAGSDLPLLIRETSNPERIAMMIKLLVVCREEHVALALCHQVVEAVDECIADGTHLGNALPEAASKRPDVLLLEHTEDQAKSAWGVLAGLAQASESTRVLLLCDSYTPSSMIGFIQRGASGCLLKSSAPSLYAKAVRTVHQGQTWFGRSELLQALRSLMVADPMGTSDVLDDEALLTAREREILTLIGNAMSNKEIARQLKISDHTVKTHLHHIYVKLDKSGRYKAFLSNTAGAPSARSAAVRGMQ
jgi:DNA-binding NarL/FixJ family response regulator